MNASEQDGYLKLLEYSVHANDFILSNLKNSVSDVNTLMPNVKSKQPDAVTLDANPPNQIRQRRHSH
jgi:hypothetical protein